MLKSVNIFLSKFKQDDTTSSRMRRNKMQVNMDNMLTKYLTDSRVVMQFEIKEKDIDDVIAIIDEPPLSDKFLIWQDEDSMILYYAKGKEVDVW